MAKVKLGRKEFDVDSEKIHACWCGVTAADCVALAARMKSGEMRRLKILYIVRLFSVSLNFSHLHLSSALFHSTTITSATTARATADAIRTNSSVRELYLVRMCCR